MTIIKIQLFYHILSQFLPIFAKIFIEKTIFNYKILFEYYDNHQDIMSENVSCFQVQI